MDKKYIFMILWNGFYMFLKIFVCIRKCRRFTLARSFLMVSFEEKGKQPWIASIGNEEYI